MSRPRTRSQGLPEGEEEDTDGQTMTQRRMSRELQVQLEMLKLFPVGQSEGGNPSLLKQTTPSRKQTRPERPASVTLRPPSIIPSASRPNSVLGFQTVKEVST